MALSYREVAEILKIIDASTCDELVLELEGTKLMVTRRSAGDGAARKRSASNAGAGNDIATETSRTESAAASQPSVAQPSAFEGNREDGLVEVRAPMVGTFYRAPSPTEPAFVEVGSSVQAGEPLCLIEVMKLYTTIEAPQAGRIVHIGAENGALVEHDHVLFVVEPS